MSKERKKDLLQHPEGSVFSEGYGTIPKQPMRDRDLTIEAKAIYAYLCSYMGAGNTAFPSVGKICFDLGISKDRYYRHRERLEAQGYIKVIRKYYTATGQKANNVYELVYERPPCPDSKEMV